MNYYNLKCLFYAVHINDDEIQRLYEQIKQRFEKTKFSKHFLTGKTTSRRKGKKEKKMAYARNSLRKITNIIKFKKMIKQLPDLKNNLVDFYCRQSLQKFLQI